MTEINGDRGNVFVTVGTTSFDALIETVSSEEILQVLKEKGFTSLRMQIGRGTFEPNVNLNSDSGISLDFYNYKDSISEDISSASLVISHAGAGTVLETLKIGKPLIVVVNEDLMDNHQVELAEQLHRDGHLLYCTCRSLKSTLMKFDASKMKPYEPGKPQIFAAFLDKVVGLV